MSEHLEITLCPANSNEQCELLHEIVKEIKSRCPSADKSADGLEDLNWAGEPASVHEITTKISQELKRLEMKRKRLIEQRDEGGQNAREEQRQSFEKLVDSLRSLRKLGVTIEIGMVGQPRTEDLEGDISSGSKTLKCEL